MAYATLNEITILSCTLEMPLIGAWRARVRIDGSVVPTGKLTLKLGSVSFVCAAYRSGTFTGTTWVEVVGGAAGLGKQVVARHYLAGTARVVFAQTISEAGESLSGSSDSKLLGQTLDVWTRVAGTAGSAIAELAAELGLSWRVLSDGTIWIGSETWPAGPTSGFDPIDQDPGEAMIEVAMESPTLVPGVKFQGQELRRVRHLVTDGSIRTQVWSA